MSIICTLFLYYMDTGKARHTKVDPPKGPKEIPGWSKPKGPPKSLNQLKELEKRDESKPLITLKQLEKHDGHKEKPWVCIKGLIYDVSANKCYDKTGGYNLFAGRDATAALATMQFDQIKQKEWRKCTKEQLECLDDWLHFFKDRYSLVGYLEDEYASKKDN